MQAADTAGTSTEAVTEQGHREGRLLEAMKDLNDTEGSGAHQPGLKDTAGQV